MTKPFKVWQDVYAIGGPDLTSPSDCCVYLIDAGELVLVDSGVGDSFNQLVANIKDLGFDPLQLKAIIITHAHIDHIGALADFKEKYGVSLIAHELDTPALETGKGTGAEFYQADYQPCLIDIKVSQPEVSLKYGRHQLNLVHIPGHTPGSLAVYADMGKRVLFGQDIHGPYMPAWGADPAQATTSLQKLIDLKADILCEGHFGIYQPASEVEQYISGYLHELQRRIK